MKNRIGFTLIAALAIALGGSMYVLFVRSPSGTTDPGNNSRARGSAVVRQSRSAEDEVLSDPNPDPRGFPAKDELQPETSEPPIPSDPAGEIEVNPATQAPRRALPREALEDLSSSQAGPSPAQLERNPATFQLREAEPDTRR